MTVLALVALLWCAAGGMVSLLLHRSAPLLAARVTVVSTCIAGIILIPVSLSVLIIGPVAPISLPWNFPGGSLTFGIDPLSALFLLPLSIIIPLAALFGVTDRDDAVDKRDMGFRWFCFGIFAASFIGVLLARNAVLFLLFWELLALSSFFLTITNHEFEKVRFAGWLYLTVSHAGAAALLAMFLVFGSMAGSFDFGSIAGLQFSGGIASSLFGLAVFGFGAKAGLVGFHVWLPEADAAAPGHVASVKSSLLVAMGIYGLLRLLTFLAPYAAAWGVVLIGLGLVTALFGILSALGQRDIRKALACSTVENMGIVVSGIGLGVFGTAHNLPVVAVAGFSAALVHTISHAFFKSLLFMASTAVLRATGTANMNDLGGLARSMPRTARAFFCGAVAGSSLPPFCGFAGEFLLLFAAAITAMNASHGVAAVGLSVLVAVALVGGLSIALFTRLYGMIFSGEARSAAAEDSCDVNRLDRLVLAVPSIVVLLLGLLSPMLLLVVWNAVQQLTQVDSGELAVQLFTLLPILAYVSAGSVLFCLCIIGAALIRSWLLSKRTVAAGPTWGCGYLHGTARIQYTADSFSRPLLEFFTGGKSIARRSLHMVRGRYPVGAHSLVRISDPIMTYCYVPFVNAVTAFADRLRPRPINRLQAGILSVVLTALVLLVWEFGVKT